MVIIAFGLARLAGSDAGARCTEINEVPNVQGCPRMSLLVTSWQQPARTGTSLFRNKHAIRAIVDLAKVAVRKRKIQEVQAVVELARYMASGLVKISRGASAFAGPVNGIRSSPSTPLDVA